MDRFMSPYNIAFLLAVVAAFTAVEAWYQRSRILARGACLVAGAGLVIAAVAR